MTYRSKHYKHQKQTSKIKYLIIGLIILLGLLALFAFNLRIDFDVSEIKTRVEYGESFTKPKAYIAGKVGIGRIVEIPLNEEVTVVSTEVGDHENLYGANFLFLSEEISVPVTVEDTTPPEIKLTYKDNHYTYPAANYVEEGFAAEDNCDGDLTEQVTIEHVNDKIIYSVTDTSNNTATVERILKYNDIDLSLKEPSQDGKLIGEGKTIYLTFDDGPTAHTDKLLATLNRHGVKATFFVVGNKGRNAKIKDIVNQGHSIAIHSVTHSYASIYKSKEAFFNDLYEMQNIIEQECGVKTFLMRFPGGSSNAVSKSYCKGIMSELVKEVQEQGFHYFDWNVSSGDAGGAKTTEQVYNNVVNGIKTKQGDSVVLQHDTQEFSVDAVDKIIRWGKINGYTFASIDMNTQEVHHGVIN